jgi:hypothetical protein
VWFLPRETSRNEGSLGDWGLANRGYKTCQTLGTKCKLTQRPLPLVQTRTGARNKATSLTRQKPQLAAVPRRLLRFPRRPLRLRAPRSGSGSAQEVRRVFKDGVPQSAGVCLWTDVPRTLGWPCRHQLVSTSSTRAQGRWVPGSSDLPRLRREAGYFRQLQRAPSARRAILKHRR